MKIFKVSQGDYEGICQVEFACYRVMYNEQPEKKQRYREMLKRRMAIAKDWMWVLKENGRVLGSTGVQPVKKESVQNFISWEHETDNGTLERTFDSTGDKVYVVNLDVLPEATARNGQHLLLSAIHKQVVETGKVFTFWESRLPMLRQYVKNTMGMEKWQNLSDQGKKAAIHQYINLKIIRNGEEVHYDKMIRFLWTYYPNPEVVVLLNAFDDPESLNCGVLYIDRRSSYHFTDALRKYSKNPEDIKKGALMLRSIINFKNAILKDPNYIKADPTSFVKQPEFSPIDKFLYAFQEAVLAPPRPDYNQFIDNEIYFKFMHYLQAVLNPTKVDYHLRQIFYDNAEVLNSERSLKHIDQWIQKGKSSGTEPAKWNPDDFELDLKQPNYGFKSWADFFLRKIKMERFPIDKDNDVVVMPCQCYPLTTPLQPVQAIQAKDKFWLKNSDYSLFDMLNVSERKNEKVAQKFVGGTIFQVFLDHWCYHRWHAPVNGVVEDIYTVPGFFFMLKPDTQRPNVCEYEAQQPFLSCSATRQVIIIKSDNQNIGRVILIAISMAEVSSCVSTVNTGERVEKGQEIGHFKLGSSMCLLFEKDCKLDFFKDNYYEFKDGKAQAKLAKPNSALCKVSKKDIQPKL